MSCYNPSNREGVDTFQYTSGTGTNANLGNKHCSTARFHLDRRATDVYLFTVLLYNLLRCETKAGMMLLDKKISRLTPNI